MESVKGKKLHHISEWEYKISMLPVDVEFVECKLDHGNVTRYSGKVKMGKRDKLLTWRSDGKCYYKEKRITSLDIKF